MAELTLDTLEQYTVTFQALNRECRFKDTRSPERIMQRFVSCNERSFRFLGIEARLVERDNNPAVVLSTSRYIGAAPLTSPANGKPYKDIVVRSRFGEDVAELVNMLEDTLSPDFCAELELCGSDNMRAPLYLECINFFNAFARAMQVPWNKFDTVRRVEAVPAHSTDWKRYAEHSHDPAQALSFCNRRSIQSTDHREWHQLTYMARVALELFSAPLTPLSLKARTMRLTEGISKYASSHRQERIEHLFVVRSLDPLAVKEAKEAANVLMQRTLANNLAWRVDSAELFERYAQYVVRQVAKKCGGTSVSNHTFAIRGPRPEWCLRYLEPDILLLKDESMTVIDAKYKSHIFNLSAGTAELKDSFRHDLHQLLAYTTFDASRSKRAALIYPHSHFVERTVNIGGGLARSEVKVHLIGIPLDTKKLPTLVDSLTTLLSIP